MKRDKVMDENPSDRTNNTSKRTPIAHTEKIGYNFYKRIVT